MILKVLVSSLFYFACSHAFSACTISDTGAGTIRLQPSTAATSTIQISVKCDTDFQIVFESTNLIDSSGQSLLKNIQAFGYTKLRNTIQVQLLCLGLLEVSGECSKHRTKISIIIILLRHNSAM